MLCMMLWIGRRPYRSTVFVGSNHSLFAKVLIS